MTPGNWRKSSRSGGNQSNGCVEARLSGGVPQLSDSQHGGIRPILPVDRDSFTGFLTTIKTGGLD